MSDWQITRDERGKVTSFVHPYRDPESISGEERRSLFDLIAQVQRETEEALLKQVDRTAAACDFEFPSQEEHFRRELRAAVKNGDHWKGRT